MPASFIGGLVIFVHGQWTPRSVLLIYSTSLRFDTNVVVVVVVIVVANDIVVVVITIVITAASLISLPTEEEGKRCRLPSHNIIQTRRAEIQLYPIEPTLREGLTAEVAVEGRFDGGVVVVGVVVVFGGEDGCVYLGVEEGGGGWVGVGGVKIFYV